MLERSARAQSRPLQSILREWRGDEDVRSVFWKMNKRSQLVSIKQVDVTADNLRASSVKWIKWTGHCISHESHFSFLPTEPLLCPALRRMRPLPGKRRAEKGLRKDKWGDHHNSAWVRSPLYLEKEKWGVTSVKSGPMSASQNFPTFLQTASLTANHVYLTLEYCAPIICLYVHLFLLPTLRPKED